MSIIVEFIVVCRSCKQRQTRADMRAVNWEWKTKKRKINYILTNTEYDSIVQYDDDFIINCRHRVQCLQTKFTFNKECYTYSRTHSVIQLPMLSNAIINIENWVKRHTFVPLFNRKKIWIHKTKQMLIIPPCVASLINEKYCYVPDILRVCLLSCKFLFIRQFPFLLNYASAHIHIAYIFHSFACTLKKFDMKCSKNRKSVECIRKIISKTMPFEKQMK